MPDNVVRLIKTHRAVEDLADISQSIAESSPDAAYRFLVAAEQTMELLVANPFLGQCYPVPCEPKLRVKPVRGFRDYLVFYKSSETWVVISRVLHGHRDIPRALEVP